MDVTAPVCVDVSVFLSMSIVVVVLFYYVGLLLKINN